MEFFEHINLIRLLAAFVVGTLLCLSGSLVQASLQNEMASPSTLGFDGIVVICVMFTFFLNIFFPIIDYFQFITFGIFLFFIFILWLFPQPKIKKIGNKFDTNISFYILLGLVFNLFVGALFSIIHFVFMNLNWNFPTALWFGHLKLVESISLIFVLICSAILFILSFIVSKDLRIISFGADLALGLGIPVKKRITQALIISLIATGLVISFFGVFSFMGIVLPLFLRQFTFFRQNLKYEIQLGSLLGGMFFLILDLICSQWVIFGSEIPVGLLSSVLGSFTLLTILLKKEIQKTNWSRL